MAQDDAVTRKLKNQLEKLYPDKTLTTNTDIMVKCHVLNTTSCKLILYYDLKKIYLDYQLFMRALTEEAERIAETENCRRIDETHIEKASNVSSRRME